MLVVWRGGWVWVWVITVTRGVERAALKGFLDLHSHFGWLMPMVIAIVAIVTAIKVIALDLCLFQRAWCSNDAQNEHEKGHDKQDGLAHVGQVVVGATTALWGCELSHSAGVCSLSVAVGLRINRARSCAVTAGSAAIKQGPSIQGSDGDWKAP